MARNKKGQKIDGWINLDKPLGMTSTQAVGKVRRLFNAQKVGHAGTLDPLASGILPIALGEATKTIPYIQDSLKTYEFTVQWGAQTSTDDSEGEIVAKSDIRPDTDAILSSLPSFTGEITQIPPKFSAIKIDGARAYDLARDGEEFEIKPRQVYVQSLDLLSQTPDTAQFIMTCGKGTYVRALARDLALKLGTYGHVAALRRTRVGGFDLGDAISLDNLEKLSNSAGLEQALLPLESALDDILAFPIQQKEADLLRNGQVLNLISRPDFQRLEKENVQNGSEVLAILNGVPVAIVRVNGPQIKPVRVFNI